MKESKVIKVTVVMPVYNAGRFLRGSVESVLGQTLDDIELLAIDDGSTDGSLGVLKEMEARDGRMRVIEMGENTGLMMVRRQGYTEARGEYVFNIDSDDTLPAGTLELLYGLAQRSGAEIATGSMRLVFEDGRSIVRPRGVRAGNSWDSYLRSILDWNTPSLAGTLFRRDLFEGHRYTCLRNVNYSEDRILLTEILVERRPRIAVTEEVTYDYLQHASSLVYARPTWDVAEKQFRSLLLSYRYVAERVEGMRADNERFMIRYLSLYIERGVDAGRLMGLDESVGRLLGLRLMAERVGMVKAVHTRLCVMSGVYCKVMNGLRRAVRRLRRKEVG